MNEKVRIILIGNIYMERVTGGGMCGNVLHEQGICHTLKSAKQASQTYVLIETTPEDEQGH